MSELPENAKRLRDRIIAELSLADLEDLDTLYELGCYLFGDADTTVQEVGICAENYFLESENKSV